MGKSNLQNIPEIRTVFTHLAQFFLRVGFLVQFLRRYPVFLQIRRAKEIPVANCSQDTAKED